MKKTKLLTSIAALALVLSLGACEVNVGDVNINGGDSSESTSEEDTSETTSEGDESSGDSGDTGEQPGGDSGDENEDKTWQDPAVAKDILTAASAITYLSWTSFHIEDYAETYAETTYLTAVETDEDDVYLASGVIAKFALSEVDGQETRTLTESAIYSDGGKYTYTPSGDTQYSSSEDSTDPIDILDEYYEAYEDVDEYIESLEKGELDYYLTKTEQGLTELVVTIPNYNYSHESTPELPEYFYTECVYVVDTNGAIVGLGYREEDVMGGIEMCYYLEEVSAETVTEKVAKADLTKYPVITNPLHNETIEKILAPLSGKTNLADAYNAIQLTITYDNASAVNDTYYITKDASGLLYGIRYQKTDNSNYTVEYYISGTTYIETVTAGTKTYETGSAASQYSTLLASYSHAVTAANEILAKVASGTLATSSYELYSGGIGYELEYTDDNDNLFVYETNFTYELKDFDVVTYNGGSYSYAYEGKIVSAEDVISATDGNFEPTNWGVLDDDTAERYHVNSTTSELEIHQADENGTCTICGKTGLNVSGLTYADNGDGTTCYVSGYTSEAGVHTLFVPSTHDGKAVTGIGNPSASSASNGAFYNNATLEFIGLPESATAINPYVFRQATALQSLEIPASIASIGNYAFYGCTALTEIDFAEDSVLTSVGNEAFHGAGLVTFNMPDTVTTIGTNIFDSCTSLTSAHISDATQTISGYTFTGCSNLTHANVPASLSEIPQYYFRNCTSITLDGIEITSTITSIALGAFYGCSKLTTVDELLTNVTSIGNSAFYNTGLVSIIIPDTVTSFGTAVFQNSKSLQYAALGTGITTIPQNTFNTCSALTTVVIAASITSIGSNAFNNASSIATIYYGGDETSWNSLSNRPTTSSYTIYYSGQWTYVDGVATPNA